MKTIALTREERAELLHALSLRVTVLRANLADAPGNKALSQRVVQMLLLRDKLRETQP